MSIQLEKVLPENFSGVVPLFPLPNLVMFPGVVQPLQIFEPRYKAMMEWTLNHEKLIAMAVLQRGELAHLERAPVKTVVCVGKIVAHTRLDDGRYKFLLIGGKRAVIENELSAPQPFRTAEVSLLNDSARYEKRELASRFAQLASAFLKHLRDLDHGGDEFRRMIDNELPLSLLTDIVASTLSLSMSTKYDLLKTTNVCERADCLLEALRNPQALKTTSPTMANGGNDQLQFPPPFSNN